MKKFTFRTLILLLLGAIGALSSPNVSAKPDFGKIIDQKITGKVSDSEKGEALPGVSITIKGTQKGTTTDVNGEFSLTVADSKAAKSTETHSNRRSDECSLAHSPEQHILPDETLPRGGSILAETLVLAGCGIPPAVPFPLCTRVSAYG